MKLPMIEKRKCEMCGCEFEITAQQKNKRYCDTCKKISYQRYRKKYQSSDKFKKMLKDRYHKTYKEKTHFNICVLCGKEFLTKQGRAKYCIPCLEEAAEKDRYFRTILERRVI